MVGIGDHRLLLGEEAFGVNGGAKRSHVAA